jgi:hypothetical protein
MSVITRVPPSYLRHQSSVAADGDAKPVAISKKDLIQQYRRAKKLHEKVAEVKSNPLSDPNTKIAKHPVSGAWFAVLCEIC